MFSDALPAEALSSAVGELPSNKGGPHTWWDLGSHWVLPQGESNFHSGVRVISMALGLIPCCLPSLQQGSILHMAVFCQTFCVSSPALSRDGLPGWPGFQLVGRLALCCDCNGRKMKNDSKAPAEIKSQIALFVEGEGN